MSIQVRALSVKYGDNIALDNINLNILDGEILTIIGPNGSGKSTLIKAMSRLIKPNSGKVLFNNKDISDIHTKDLAKEMAILPQEKDLCMDVTVEELVSYGRQPHLGFGKRLSCEDYEIIEWAMRQTGMFDYKDRYVMTLSGGERQRAWISMALAQRPKVLIMDEPTTYLDISYQLEVLELVKELNRELGLTVIMILHDLNQASRYSDRLYVLKEGKVYEYGQPKDIIKSTLLRDVFSIDAHIYSDEVNNCKFFIPYKNILRS